MYLPSAHQNSPKLSLTKKVFHDRENTGIFNKPQKKNVKGNNLSITIIIIFFVFLGPHTRHIEVPRLEVELEL